MARAACSDKQRSAIAWNIIDKKVTRGRVGVMAETRVTEAAGGEVRVERGEE
jgi:hypothetical protein